MRRYCVNEKCSKEESRFKANYCSQCGSEVEIRDKKVSLANIVLPIAGVITGVGVSYFCEYLAGRPDANSFRDIFGLAAFVAGWISLPSVFNAVISAIPTNSDQDVRGEENATKRI